jgi:hypothetical protein
MKFISSRDFRWNIWIYGSCLFIGQKKIFAYEFSQFKKYTISTLKKPHTECSEFFILWKFKICDWILLDAKKNTIALSNYDQLTL